jgi:peptidoglycan/xylan/chitin deacetylase (PgdA/CDA1 family)
MAGAGLARKLAEAWEVPRDLLLGRYPAFVRGGALRRGEIPVFVFHGAEPADLARKLEHLAAGGYQTLSIDEYVGVIRGERDAPDRAVLLTFDDGRGSFWSVAAPLLRRRGMRAVVFLVPGRMRERGISPTWEDVEAGRSSADEVLGRERGEGALLSWQEVETLAAGGHFDFQSHTLRHARIHVSPGLGGFVTPGSWSGYLGFDLPLVRRGELDLLAPEVPLGTPFLRSAPRTSDELRFLEDEDIRRACVETVAAGGGEAFFERPDWRRRLERVFARARVRGARETPEQRANAIAHELREARRLIEERTGRPAVHLCYPWHTAGETARRLAQEAGYRTAFCGKVRGVPTTLPGGDLSRVARLGEDYVELLPGPGRATLVQVLRRKWARRFGAALR